MGTDSLMDLLKSDINGLVSNSPFVTERIHADLEGWYIFACEVLANHANETEAQVMSRIVAQVYMMGDLPFWRQSCGGDPICTKDGLTDMGDRILDSVYVQVTLDTIKMYTTKSIVSQRRKRMRLLLAPSTQQKIVGGLMSLVSLMEVVL